MSPSPCAPDAAADRVVLITGAARRIGAQIARRLHGDGWRVLVHYGRSAEAAAALVAELQATRPDSAAALSADLAQLERLPALAAQAWARFGRLDALVNNASTFYRTPLATLSPEQFDDLVATNLRAPLFLAQACAPRLADGGAIVNILDVYARRPHAGFSAYFAAKAGLWAVTEALALELAPRLRVNAIAPGHIVWAPDCVIAPAQKLRELDKIPLQRLGGEDAIARAVRFLLSADAGYMTGAVLPVDGGLRLS
jgi:pteridine reductase